MLQVRYRRRRLQAANAPDGRLDRLDRPVRPRPADRQQMPPNCRPAYGSGAALGARHGSTGDPDYRPPTPVPNRMTRAWADENRAALAGFDEAAARRALPDAHRHRCRPFLQVDDLNHRPLIGHVISYVAGPLPGKAVLVATSTPKPVQLRYERHG
jgi:hypothetical protein